MTYYHAVPIVLARQKYAGCSIVLVKMFSLQWKVAPTCNVADFHGYIHCCMQAQHRAGEAFDSAKNSVSQTADQAGHRASEAADRTKAQAQVGCEGGLATRGCW